MNFTKMHGLGNDYVYVNCFTETITDPVALAVEISDRHFGVGSDGLILICPSDAADVKMRMFNADGSEAQMCGNGIRCVAKYAYDHDLVHNETQFSVPGHGTFQRSMQIETGRGVLTVGLETDGDDKVQQVCVIMGQPILEPSQIPVDIDTDQIVDTEVDIQGQQVEITCVSMGNPHVMFFCQDLDEVDLPTVGPAVENHPMFPERINAHFVKVQTPSEITIKTWERGSGITLACGTGACACAVAGYLTGRCKNEVLAHLPGGDLQLYWCQQDNCVYMTGPATEVFSGTWPI